MKLLWMNIFYYVGEQITNSIFTLLRCRFPDYYIKINFRDFWITRFKHERGEICKNQKKEIEKSKYYNNKNKWCKKYAVKCFNIDFTELNGWRSFIHSSLTSLFVMQESYSQYIRIFRLQIEKPSKKTKVINELVFLFFCCTIV